MTWEKINDTTWRERIATGWTIRSEVAVPDPAGTWQLTAPVTPPPPPPVVVVPPPVGQARPAAAKGTGFFVANGKVYDGNGAPFLMKGINHTVAWGWYEHNFEAIPAIAKTNANTVRLVFSTGIGHQNEVERVIAEAVRCKLVPCVGAWMGTGKTDVASLNTCVDYWLRPENVAALKKYERQVILNIANEWGGFDGGIWRSAYTTAIQRIRAAGVNCMIMIDAGGAYGQNPRTVRDFGQSLLAGDPNQNLLFSIHFYGYWRTVGQAGVGSWNDFATQSPWRVADEVKAIVAKGLPLIIGEIGAGGPQVPYVAKNALLDLKALDVGWLAWSWNQNSDSALDLMLVNSGWLYPDDSALSAGGKLFVLDPEVGLKATAKAATIW